MENPTYLVNIIYIPSHINGQNLVSLNGITQSIPTYSSSYFQASMPEIKISATGSSYTDALDNLLLIATDSTTLDNSLGPINNTRTW